MKINVFQFKIDELRYDDELEIWFVELTPFASCCDNNLLNLLVWKIGIKNGIRIEHFENLDEGLLADSESLWDYQPICSGVRYDFHHKEVPYHAISFFGVTNVIVELTDDQEWLRMYHFGGPNDREQLIRKWKNITSTPDFNNATNWLNLEILQLRSYLPKLFGLNKAIPIY